MIGDLNTTKCDMGKFQWVICIYQECTNLNPKFPAISPFLVTLERSQVVSYSHPVGDVYHTFFIKNPTDTFNMAAYTNTLTGLAWIAIGLFCIICPVFMYLATQ